jgi:hypothetical protein
MNDQGLSRSFIGLGVLLIVVGALFFVGQAVGFDLGRSNGLSLSSYLDWRSPESASQQVVPPASG